MRGGRGVAIFVMMLCHSRRGRVHFLPTMRHLGYERVYLPLHEVADAPFHIQGDVMAETHTVVR